MRIGKNLQNERIYYMCATCGETSWIAVDCHSKSWLEKYSLTGNECRFCDGIIREMTEKEYLEYDRKTREEIRKWRKYTKKGS